jgi:DMSO/TMAO reductase YedYZ molybdopterin-dependent catalytic subunit
VCIEVTFKSIYNRNIKKEQLERRIPLVEMAMHKERQRIPPNQRVTSTFPVLHVGAIPRFDPKTWDFVVEGLVRNPLRLTYKEFLKLPKVISLSDFHCVTGWSKLDNRWEGVAVKIISDMVKPLKEVKFVTVVAERGYTTSLPLDDLLDDDVLLAYKLDGNPLEPRHGGPLRLVVPKKYAYKSAKWVRKLRFTKEQELGYWEKRGYSNTANPWKEDRYT